MSQQSSQTLNSGIAWMNRAIPVVAAFVGAFNTSDDRTGSIDAQEQAGRFNGSGPPRPDLARRDAPRSFHEESLGVPVDASGNATRSVTQAVSNSGPLGIAVIVVSVLALAKLFKLI